MERFNTDPFKSKRYVEAENDSANIEARTNKDLRLAREEIPRAQNPEQRRGILRRLAEVRNSPSFKKTAQTTAIVSLILFGGVVQKTNAESPKIEPINTEQPQNEDENETEVGSVHTEDGVKLTFEEYQNLEDELFSKISVESWEDPIIVHDDSFDKNDEYVPNGNELEFKLEVDNEEINIDISGMSQDVLHNDQTKYVLFSLTKEDYKEGSAIAYQIGNDGTLTISLKDSPALRLLFTNDRNFYQASIVSLNTTSDSSDPSGKTPKIVLSQYARTEPSNDYLTVEELLQMGQLPIHEQSSSPQIEPISKNDITHVSYPEDDEIKIIPVDPTITNTTSPTSTESPLPTVTIQSTSTQEATETATQTITPTSSPTNTETPVSTATATPYVTATSTITSTPESTATIIPSVTPTPDFTETSIPTSQTNHFPVDTVGGSLNETATHLTPTSEPSKENTPSPTATLESTQTPIDESSAASTPSPIAEVESNPDPNKNEDRDLLPFVAGAGMGAFAMAAAFKRHRQESQPNITSFETSLSGPPLSPNDGENADFDTYVNDNSGKYPNFDQSARRNLLYLLYKSENMTQITPQAPLSDTAAQHSDYPNDYNDDAENNFTPFSPSSLITPQAPLNDTAAQHRDFSNDNDDAENNFTPFSPYLVSPLSPNMTKDSKMDQNSIEPEETPAHQTNFSDESSTTPEKPHLNESNSDFIQRMSTLNTFPQLELSQKYPNRAQWTPIARIWPNLSQTERQTMLNSYLSNLVPNQTSIPQDDFRIPLPQYSGIVHGPAIPTSNEPTPQVDLVNTPERGLDPGSLVDNSEQSDKFQLWMDTICSADDLLGSDIAKIDPKFDNIGSSYFEQVWPVLSFDQRKKLLSEYFDGLPLPDSQKLEKMTIDIQARLDLITPKQAKDKQQRTSRADKRLILGPAIPINNNANLPSSFDTQTPIPVTGEPIPNPYNPSAPPESDIPGTLESSQQRIDIAANELLSYVYALTPNEINGIYGQLTAGQQRAVNSNTSERAVKRYVSDTTNRKLENISKKNLQFNPQAGAIKQVINQAKSTILEQWPNLDEDRKRAFLAVVSSSNAIYKAQSFLNSEAE